MPTKKQTVLPTKKIKIGVSQCLLGDNVRYNGETKANPYIIEILSKQFDYIAVCPEVECGMDVPREPLRLEIPIDDPKMVTHHSKIDYTDQMNSWAYLKVEELLSKNICGFIFKARSPSCGIKEIPIFDGENEVSKTQGLFVSTLKMMAPSLPLIDEEMIVDPKMLQQFIEKANSYAKDSH